MQTRMQITEQEQNTNLDRLQRKRLDRIEPISRAEALIPDDVILTRSGSLDTGYRVLDDTTSG